MADSKDSKDSKAGSKTSAQSTSASPGKSDAGKASTTSTTRSAPDRMTMTSTGKTLTPYDTGKGETTANQDPIPAQRVDYSADPAQAQVTTTEATDTTEIRHTSNPPAPYHPGPPPNLIHQPQYEAQTQDGQTRTPTPNQDPEAHKKYQPGEPGYQEPGTENTSTGKEPERQESPSGTRSGDEKSGEESKKKGDSGSDTEKGAKPQSNL